ncbi:S1 family peptidase [Phytoactinopolyspora halophila]|uniref:S1 family peptidase n=1 Tax=Phytoactinopolyspora halophila TaxID=1981511 RepID=UPI000F4D59C1|nr:S1 family peptidase [Phytoactinopolyspora halophila]
MSVTLPRRRMVRDAACRLVVAVMAGTAMPALAGSAMAVPADGEPTASDEIPSDVDSEDHAIHLPVTWQTFEPLDFVNQALELPSGLHEAVERDLGGTVEEFLADAATARSASHVVESLRAEGVGVAAAVFDRDEGSLGILPADADGESVEAIEATGAVVLDEPPESPDVNAPIVPHDEFKGGYGYGEPQEDGTLSSYCSAGFNGYSTDGEPVVITAGHCFPDAGDDTRWVHIETEEPWTPDTPGWPEPGADLGIGSGGAWQFADGHDVGLFRVTEPDWTPVPAITTWDGGDGDPRAGEIEITDQAAPIVGQPVCRSGITSGYQCGEVLAVDHEVDYGVEYGSASVTGFLTSACSAPGDSGGPFVSGTHAVGMLSGAGGPESGQCADWDPEKHVSFGYALSGSRFSADEFYTDGEWELAVAVSTPDITVRQDDSGAPVIEGEVEHAGPHHVIGVRVDEQVYSEAISADGTFSIRIDDPRPAEGVHRFAAQARYGVHSRSDIVEGTLQASAPPDAEGAAEGDGSAADPGEDVDDQRDEDERADDEGEDGDDEPAENGRDGDPGESGSGSDGSNGSDEAEDRGDDAPGDDGSGGDGEELPDTGVDWHAVALVGVGLACAGIAVGMWASVRRRLGWVS